MDTPVPRVRDSAMVMNGFTPWAIQRVAMEATCGTNPSTAATSPAAMSFSARAMTPKM